MKTETAAEFTEAGLDCLVLRMTASWGLWHCGYVRIPEGTALHNVEYLDPVPPALKPAEETVLQGPLGNRGVMFILGAALGAGPRVGDLIDVHGSITFTGALKDREGYWWGFDVNHLDDQETGRSADQGFAEAQTRSMARQLSTLIA